MFNPIDILRVATLNGFYIRTRYDLGDIQDLYLTTNRFRMVPGWLFMIKVYAIFSGNLYAFFQTLTAGINGALFNSGSVRKIFTIIRIKGR